MSFQFRIGEMFEIIVDYPESEPAVCDLQKCLEKVDLKNELINNLSTRCVNVA